MKIATTTGDFGRYCENDIERIRELYRAGFRYIDLNMYSFTPDSVYMSDEWRDAVKDIKNEADSLGMKFVQAHSQGGNALSDDEDHVSFIKKATLRSLEICALLGIENTVVHPGSMKYITKEEWFYRNRDFFNSLLPTAEALGVNILTENSTAVNMSASRYFANTGKDMKEFLEFVGNSHLHACWDTGHGNCEGAQYDELMTLGKDLYAIHYNDNHGKSDEHLVPFLGTLNHDEIMNALIDMDYKGYFTLECNSGLIPKQYWLGGRRDFAGESRLAEPQLFMRRHMEALMYDTAKYILEAYDAFEK